MPFSGPPENKQPVKLNYGVNILMFVNINLYLGDKFAVHVVAFCGMRETMSLLGTAFIKSDCLD